MTRTAVGTGIAAWVAAAALMGGCSAAPIDVATAADDSSTTSIATTTSTEAPTTATVHETTTTTAATPEAPPAVSLTSDLIYLTAGGHDYLIDVYAPDGDGPRPVVVVFHGWSLGLKDDSYATSIAEAAAEQGMVAFVPSWVKEFGSSVDADDLDNGFAASACALAFALREALTYGGDPERIVTYGYSAGSPMAAWLALGHGTELPTGCVAEQPARTPAGAVLGDSEYFLHSQLFDDGFDADATAMQSHVASLVDPAAWPDDLSSRFRIWSAANGTQWRPLDDPAADDSWLAQRDPDGSIRADLDELGDLADGGISFVDEGRLLAKRLQSVGVDASVDEFPGGHAIDDKIPELVAYLFDAAGSAVTGGPADDAYSESRFDSPEAYAEAAREYCAAWPDVGEHLRADASFAVVPGDGLAVPDRGGFSKGISEDVAQGRDATVEAIARADLPFVECGSRAVVSGDWVAMPGSASRADGSGIDGIWMLRIIGAKVQWHLFYGTDSEKVAPVSAEADEVLVSEARAFCAIIEGTGYTRSADDFLAAMSDDPRVHNNPEGLYWTGVDEVRAAVDLYPPSDDIWCGDDITTGGRWSAEPVTIDNPQYGLSQVGMMVHYHVDGAIHSQFAHFTRTAGDVPWGLPLEG